MEEYKMIRELDNTAQLVLKNNYRIENQYIDTKKYLYRFAKRTFDIFVSLVGLFVLIPLIVVVKIVTVCSGDFHSIFYSQDRIGKDGRIFKLYKFRSMIPNADQALAELLKKDKKLAKEYKRMKKLDNDPRITKIGKFLRMTSLDELPQMINILKNDMTLIGNRPYLPREKKDMGAHYNRIILTKPGLTGFWQVSLRNRGTFEQRLKMEEYYSENCGLRFDISIFFKTFEVVLKREGAK